MYNKFFLLHTRLFFTVIFCIAQNTVAQDITNTVFGSTAHFTVNTHLGVNYLDISGFGITNNLHFGGSTFLVKSGQGSNLLEITQTSITNTLAGGKFYVRNPAGQSLLEIGDFTLGTKFFLSGGPIMEFKGPNQISLGTSNTSSGNKSISLGTDLTSSGTNSIALGNGSTSSGTNSISIGRGNISSGEESISIGSFTEASGFRSYAFGYNVSTNSKTGAFIIGDGNSIQISSSANHEMTMRFSGGYRLFSSSDGTFGVSLATSGSSWASISDSTKKENFVYADGEYFLNSLSNLRLGSWNYKGQNSEEYRHYGPMAQEIFHYFGKDEFGVIGNDTTLATADMDGIIMICLQALEKRTTELQKENEQLRAELNDLQYVKEQLSEIENLKEELYEQVRFIKESNIDANVKVSSLNN